jgi:hypothetical protein
MWRTTNETVEHATADDVQRELRAQIERALEAGIDVTHLDSHMGTVMRPKFARVYVRLAREYRLPAFFPRVDIQALKSHGFEGADLYEDLLQELESEGFPIFDRFDSNSLHYEPGTGLKHNTQRIDGLGPGLSYLITHCAEGGPELESITADWRQRDEEHRIYSDGSMARVFEDRGVRTVGMRAIRDLLRGQ